MGPDLRYGVVLPTLRAWRLHRMISQDELAERAHVARWTVQRAEQGLPVKVTTAARLARALRVEREVLLRSTLPSDQGDQGAGQ